MANVKFLRGLQNNLPSGSSIVDGALYFTTDSKRLFLGQDNSGTKVLLPIAEGITSVESVTSLGSAAEHTGQFYYVAPSGAQGNEAGNILAYSDGTKWLQVNMSTHISTMSEAVDADGTVTLTINDSAGAAHTASFQVIGNENVTVSAENGKLKISVADDENTTYTLGKAASGDDVNITLTPSEGDAQSVTLADGEGINVNIAQDKIVFDINAQEIPLVDGVTVAAETQGFSIAVDTTNNGHPSDTLDPVITYGTSADQSVHFVSGTATLAVPTINEVNTAIDNLRRSINAMRYMGAVASEAAMPTVAADNAFHNGDVYLASTDFTIGTGSEAKDVKKGSLIVVQGTEGTDGTIPASDVTYAIVEGDTTDTTYKGIAVTNGIGIATSLSPTANVAELIINGSSDGVITVSESQSAVGGSAENNVNTLTIGHGAVTRTDGAATNYSVDLLNGNAEFTIVTGVTTNSQGHVTGIATKNVTISSTGFDPGSWSTTAVANNEHTSSAVTISSSGQNAQSFGFTIASTGSIDITASGDTTTIDVVWGTF